MMSDAEGANASTGAEFLGYPTAEFGTSLILAPGARGTQIISNLRFTINGGHDTEIFLAKPRYATFLKIALKNCTLLLPNYVMGGVCCKLAPQAHSTLLFWTQRGFLFTAR